MEIEIYVVIYIVCLIAECALSGLRHFYFGLIIPVLTAVVFFVTIDDSLYELLAAETIVFVVMRAAKLIASAIKKKKRQSEIDKSRAQDL
ncbi:MAG: hypothetical protein LUD27_07510 [Clostridia bacterium]|nr:hypothetical protein [Clostridia bacterium]